MNDALRTLQDTLVRAHKRLTDQLDQTDDPDQINAILTEMREVTHRIQLTGGLLFSEQTSELEDKVKAVSGATRKVNQAIADIRQLEQFFDTLSDFFALVDDAIDLAKKLA